MVRVLSPGPYGKRAARTVPGGAACSPSHQARRPRAGAGRARAGRCFLPQPDVQRSESARAFGNRISVRAGLALAGAPLRGTPPLD